MRLYLKKEDIQILTLYELKSPYRPRSDIKENNRIVVGTLHSSMGKMSTPKLNDF